MMLCMPRTYSRCSSFTTEQLTINTPEPLEQILPSELEVSVGLRGVDPGSSPWLTRFVSASFQRDLDHIDAVGYLRVQGLDCTVTDCNAYRYYETLDFAGSRGATPVVCPRMLRSGCAIESSVPFGALGARTNSSSPRLAGALRSRTGLARTGERDYIEPLSLRGDSSLPGGWRGSARMLILLRRLCSPGPR